MFIGPKSVLLFYLCPRKTVSNKVRWPMVEHRQSNSSLGSLQFVEERKKGKNG